MNRKDEPVQDEPVLTEFQRQQKESWLNEIRARQPLASMDEQRRQRIERTVLSKIKFTPQDNGGLAKTFDASLSSVELFAIGEIGTPDWSFLPVPVLEKLKASGWDGARTYPADPSARKLIELERRTILETLSDPDAEHGRSYLKLQADKASKPRKKSLAEIIEHLATAPEHAGSSAKELWLPFFSMLESADLSPYDHETHYSYEGRSDKRSNMKLVTFQNRISEYRSGKKSR